MYGKRNCWEVQKCGRHPNDASAADRGVCPAATAGAMNGVHGGENGGRSCWVVVGTFCDGKHQGTYADKTSTCERCDFYRQVRQEEGGGFILAPLLLKRLRS